MGSIDRLTTPGFEASVGVRNRERATSTAALRPRSSSPPGAQVADAEDHRDRGRSSRARHKPCFGAEPKVRIQFPPGESPQTIGSAGDFTIYLGMIRTVLEAAQMY